MAEPSTVPVKTTNGKMQPWRPFTFLDEIEDEMEKFFRSPFLATLPWSISRAAPTAAVWAPRMDVYEKDGRIIVKAELPGMKKEDVQVEIAGDELVIRGDSKAEREVKEENYYRIERRVGSFHRRLQLPPGIKQDDIQATMQDGVLELRISKPAPSQPQPTKIDVK